MRWSKTTFIDMVRGAGGGAEPTCPNKCRYSNDSLSKNNRTCPNTETLPPTTSKHTKGTVSPEELKSCRSSSCWQVFSLKKKMSEFWCPLVAICWCILSRLLLPGGSFHLNSSTCQYRNYNTFGRKRWWSYEATLRKKIKIKKNTCNDHQAIDLVNN